MGAWPESGVPNARVKVCFCAVWGRLFLIITVFCFKKPLLYSIMFSYEVPLYGEPGDYLIMISKKLLVGIGDRLRALRSRLGISQQSLGARLKLSRTGYGRYETGENSIGLPALAKLASDMDVSLDWLIAGKGPVFFKQKATVASESGMSGQLDEVQDLLEHMEKIPVLRYEIFGAFHRFKLEHKDLVAEVKE
ncbi:MAG: helix-turn-helix domain-containing protein [bacterium]|nr:helix-turn-helix domain-containing protein [bacterium]